MVIFSFLCAVGTLLVAGHLLSMKQDVVSIYYVLGLDCGKPLAHRWKTIVLGKSILQRKTKNYEFQSRLMLVFVILWLSNMLVKYQKDLYYIRRKILDQQRKEKKIVLNPLFLLSKSAGHLFIILSRETLGLLIHTEYVYIRPLMPEISPS